MKINKKHFINLSLAIMSLSLFNATVVRAQTNCYSFDKPPVDTVYDVGQTVDTQYADINVLRFVGGINIGNARITESNIIDGAQPSLLIGAATVQVIPRSAQTTGHVTVC